MCSPTPVPFGVSTFTPTTPVANLEEVQGIYIPANDQRPSLFTMHVNIHYEQGKTHRVPQLEFLGPRNTLFYIAIKKKPDGQSFRCPYHVYFQTSHRHIPNKCVSAITQGSPKYEWFGDIVALKFDGNRMERFKDASLTDDMSNIASFFMTEAIPSQEVHV
ncbi:hypothetical protein FRC11_011458 [Ceratobasidium sp. 423]|nr:hypothetical protein FRC11_011458 [Ceratobasidium sp. 423]